MSGSQKINIIVPVYNTGKVLEQTIQSILKQSYPAEYMELILVDDCSDDPITLRIIDEYASGYSNVKNIRAEKNSGVAYCRNLGVEAAQYEWVAFLDSDDVWPENSVTNRMSVLEIYPDASFISSDFSYLHENGSIDTEGFYENRKNTKKKTNKRIK